MAVISRAKQQFRDSRQPRYSAADPCRHPSINSPDSDVSSLPRSLLRRSRQVPNDFGEDADQFLFCRTNSIGAEVTIKHQLSRSSFPSYDEAVAPGQTSLLYNTQFRFKGQLQTYYPLHQGPRITVSSADGTTLYADGESDSKRNAAAQSLYRALQRQQTNSKLQAIDGHLDKIFGAVEVDLNIRDTTSFKRVNISQNDWDVPSECGTIIEDGDNRRKRRWWMARELAGKLAVRWDAWAVKMSRILR